MLLLTGPNASGKTVYLRMVGITCFLAHIGSFVPAESATVGLTDAIFTRMVSRESTLANASAFMADLTQMSNMMRHSTRRSLCLVDEFGKGTNAQDGISFLYACLRHFLDRGRECPRLLACTHYTELLELPELVDRPGLSLWTMQASVMLEKKTEADDTLDDVIFLYRAIPGRSEGSFAYHCAAAANVPRAVIDRAVQVSRLRDAGEPVHAMDRSEADAASERRPSCLLGEAPW
ncbi:hypothetical protein EMIHUDRAFT_221548 [Emiliania huxleyi CCMP1516]|uniref:DNA mismatch repair proteins mutS family domain-containing protein n=2 Tax=Emiliania huxleyi TaxID=2903 RepID=A0A0D3HYL8_EMIH1|nr:hypothetical protein EMIHUDRAFT_221548 [Emiliania huxleyi CCMP1516]EOD04103.1 hypothetical protein EMIHUDRAFT_221548 [Emiliania huxleyi CCMP1516]|eukprot:XP_005756532.1 hypothetical protein EMIHUDRAFT_221548 [Emiliania huxleyi CCMP1516]